MRKDEHENMEGNTDNLGLGCGRVSAKDCPDDFGGDGIWMKSEEKWTSQRSYSYY